MRKRRQTIYHFSNNNEIVYPMEKLDVPFTQMILINTKVMSEISRSALTKCQKDVYFLIHRFFSSFPSLYVQQKMKQVYTRIQRIRRNSNVLQHKTSSSGKQMYD